MKKILLIAFVLIAVIVGGVYVLGRNAQIAIAPELPRASSTPIVSTSTPDTTKKIPEEGDATFALGETAAFKGLLVTAMSVEEDSRCPTDVQCIQAGTVRVRLLIQSGLGTTTKVVKLGEFVTTETKKITFLSVTPAKVSATSITPSDYRFTVRIEKHSSSGVIPPVKGACVVGGCSGEVCSSEPGMASICIYKEEFACYKTAKCERQVGGQCGWTQTTALKQCVQDAS